MKISIYEKFWRTLGLLVLVGFILGVVAVETNLKAVLFCFFGWAFIASYILFKIKCPNCGSSLTYKGTVAGLPIYSGFASRNCKNCGCALCSK